MNEFKITMRELGEVKIFKDTEDCLYTWSVGMSGELIIYYSKQHKIISSAEVDAGILAVYAAGQWIKVDATVS